MSADLAASRAAATTTELGNFVSVAGLDNTTVYEIDSVTVDVPADGQLIAILTGSAVFFANGRTVEVGIGDTNAALDSSSTIGRLDGGDTDRFYGNYAVTATYEVTAGTFDLYALTQGNTVFDASSVNVTAESITTIFVPDPL